MNWAINSFEQPVALVPQAKALCAICKANLRAHCGDVLTWHWHHEGKDCDPWSEPETKWHQEWKSKFPEAFTEKVKGSHRADILTANGLAIEFQHSSISFAEIQERENFWGGIVWVFDARDWFDNFDLRLRPQDFSFRWKHPRQSMFAIERPLFLDAGSEIFQITFLGRGIPCGGVGRFIPYPYFVRSMMTSKPEKAKVAKI
ncbi:hypothetical protein MLD52_15650 [Puniceicoccaceae bacterium K14]|nr:hypothetical protein [Puniceicoccaceae bacterium K14]